jgi:VCBS repeat-containing protein
MFPPVYKDTLSVMAFDNPSFQGAIVNVNPDGSFSFDPTGVPFFQTRGVGEFIIDSFDYTVTDGTEIDTATVYIQVNGTNDSPIAYDDQETLHEDLPILIPQFNGILENDVDVDMNDILSVVANDFSTANGATVTLNSGGGYVYDPTGSPTLQALAEGEYLIDSFIYIVTDGNGGMDTGSVILNVTGVNDAPEITTANIIQAVEGQNYSVDYDADEIDASDVLTWTLATNATGLNIVAGTGVLSGTLATGMFYANVSVSDGNNGLDWTNFTLTVLSDIDGDGTPDYIDPDFLTVTEFNNQTVNQTVWNNQTVNQTVYNNSTAWHNSTENLTIGVSDADSDGDGWSDAVEIAGGSDPLDSTDMPSDADGDGIADFMDPDFYDSEPETVTVTEIPLWAWAAVIAAIVLGVLAAIGFMRGGGKSESEERVPEQVEQVPPAPPQQ